ncbi:hypothetical protein SAMN05216320_109183 [Duganella sp. OV458]|nr:hypothetical protein SAMN05216320_109183 [Duganella sp. OV458]SDK18897.1 hypothetical protein SAMN05428973_10999 [Duganella sp. OV510]
MGMPAKLRARFVQAAGPQEIEVTCVLADTNPQGVLQLRPFPKQATADLRNYLDDLEDLADAYVLLLPYTERPPNVDDLLCQIEEAGGEVVEPMNGEQGWPKLLPRRPLTAEFNDALFGQLCETVFAQDDAATPVPSISLRSARDRHPKLLVAESAFNVCDEIAPLRHAFVAEAMDAFVLFLQQDGAVGRIDSFLRGRGLRHAQTGGSVVTVKVFAGQREIKTFDTETHVKQGDGTTVQAAARIYYCTFKENGVLYLAVLYAGPHPDGAMTCKIQIDT